MAKTRTNPTVAGDDLRELTAEAVRFSAKRGMLPILSNVLVRAASGTLTITATDLEAVYTREVAVEGDADGSVVVRAKLLSDTAARVPDGQMVELSFNAKKKALALSWEGARAELMGLPPEDFPVVDRKATEERCVLAAAQLLGLIDRATFAADTLGAPGMPLTGALIEIDCGAFTIVTADPHHMVMQGAPVTGDTAWSAIVPAAPLREVGRLLGGASDESVTIASAGEGIVLVTFGRTRVGLRTFNLQYPNIRKIIPARKPACAIRVPRAALIEAVGLASAYGDGSNYVGFEVMDGAVRCTGAADQSGSAHMRIEAKTEGTFAGAFDPKILRQTLVAYDRTDVLMEFGGPRDMVVIKDPDDPRFIAVLAPMVVRS